MDDLSGITTQYGFIYQRAVFINFLLECVNKESTISYEKIDDCGVETESSVIHSIVYASKKKFIQVKSGHPSKDSISRALAKWLQNSDTEEYCLILENTLNFNINDEDFILLTFNEIKTGYTKQINSIMRNTHDLFKVEGVFDEGKCISALRALVFKVEISVIPFNEMIEKNQRKFSEEHCRDITITNIVKTHRYSEFEMQINKKIDDKIVNKKPLILTGYMLDDIIFKIKQKMADDHYEENFHSFKTSAENRKKVNDILNSNLREVKELKKVFHDEKEKIFQFLTTGIFYEKLRNVYISIGEDDILNTEECAYLNYKVVKGSLKSEGTLTPEKLFFSTLRSRITSSVLGGTAAADVYNKGCYIFLTTEEADLSTKISWGEEDE